MTLRFSLLGCIIVLAGCNASGQGVTPVKNPAASHNATGASVGPGRVGPWRVIQSATATISAKKGGTVDVDGSSVKFPAHVFVTDTKVKLELLSAPDVQPINANAEARGQMLALNISGAKNDLLRRLPTFQHGVQPVATADRPVMVTQILPSNESAYSSDLIPEVEKEGAPVWMDFGGSVTGRTATLNLPAIVLREEAAGAGSTMQFVPVDYKAAKPYYGGLVLSNGVWRTYDPWTARKPHVPGHHAIVFVHGILSSIEGPTGTNGAFTPEDAQAIENAGGYDAAYGFDYDWSLGPKVGGANLAHFLNGLYQRKNVDAFDIEAHSYGGIITLYALWNPSSAQHTAYPLNVITLGSPLGGTPAANIEFLRDAIDYVPDFFASEGDLRVATSPGAMVEAMSSKSASPGGSLYSLETSLYPIYAPPRTIEVAGTLPFSWEAVLNNLKYYFLLKVLFKGPFDGLVPEYSALSDNVPTAYRGTFPLTHTDLQSAPEVQQFVKSSLEAVPQWNVALVGTPSTAPTPRGCTSTQTSLCLGLHGGQSATVSISDTTGQYYAPMIAATTSPCPYIMTAVDGNGPSRQAIITAARSPGSPVSCKVVFNNYDRGNLLPPFSKSPSVDVAISPPGKPKFVLVTGTTGTCANGNVSFVETYQDQEDVYSMTTGCTLTSFHAQFTSAAGAIGGYDLVQLASSGTINGLPANAGSAWVFCDQPTGLGGCEPTTYPQSNVYVLAGGDAVAAGFCSGEIVASIARFGGNAGSSSAGGVALIVPAPCIPSMFPDREKRRQ